MSRWLVMSSALALTSSAVFAGLIDPDLDQRLREAAPDEVISTLVYLDAQLDVSMMKEDFDAQRATLAQRHQTVVTELRGMANATQQDLLATLDGRGRAGGVESYQPFWVANVVRLDGTPEAIRAIADHRDVRRVYLNYGIELIEPASVRDDDAERGARVVEPGVDAVRAPEVWALGYTGEGVLVANMDTGVDGNHPALASRWAGLLPEYEGHPEWAWYDPYAGQNDFPYDDGGHGTHTMGSVCGGSPGDEIGVAPGANWIASAPIDRGGGIPQTVADAISSFQWMVDPDGNPATSWDVPDVCSNSWGVTSGHGYPECDELFWQYLDNCEAAGIVIVFSAGNEGTSGLRRPADRATNPYNVCAVAAVDANVGSWPIASFSSRGPTYCTPTGEPAIKPDIAAPGVDVRSSVPGGGYQFYSGTSMASPHVNGVIALMRQANPDLTPDQIKQIIYDTAYDLGSAGEDNSYGWGMIDAYEAVQVALETVAISFQFPQGRPEFIDPNGGTAIRVEVTGHAVEPEPGTGMVYFRADGGAWDSMAMTEVEPDVYDAVLPAFSCGTAVDYYFSVEAATGEVAYSPFSAPDVFYSGDAYTGIQVYHEDDFESDTGWEVFAGATTGNWERANPQEVVSGFFDPVITQPEDDHSEDGTLCWVTGAAAGGGAGDFDVDGGPSRLTSPAFDLSDTDAVVSYWRWYHISTEWNDELVVQVSDDNGTTWVTVETIDNRVTWARAEWKVSDYVDLTDQVRVRFIVDDSPNDSLVEALIDDFMITELYCEDAGIPGDINGDGVVDVTDLLGLLAEWGPCDGCPEDLNDDGMVDVEDLLALLANWG